MSSLEIRTRAVFLRILSQVKIELSEAEAQTLAAWSFKTFALMHLTDRGERKTVVKTSDLSRLYRLGMPGGQLEVSLTRAAALNGPRLKVFMPRIRYSSTKGFPIEELATKSSNFVGLMQFGEILLIVVYKMPAYLWVTNLNSRLRGEAQIWPIDHPLRIDKATLPMISDTSDVEVHFTAIFDSDR